MTAKRVLLAQLGVMVLLIAAAVLAPERFEATLRAHPELYLHAKLAHVLSATLFFGNVVIGTLWETRSLLSDRLVLIRHTYATVAWLDAFFTAPLILVAVLSGLLLGTQLGGLFSMGWLVIAFGLFVLSGLVWVAVDIPSQRKVKAIFGALEDDSGPVPAELRRALAFRVKLNVCTIVPLLIVMALMVQKPAVPMLDRHLPAARPASP